MDEPASAAPPVPDLLGRPRRWLRRRNVLIVVAVAAVVGFLAWFPGWCLRRAHRQALDCTNRIFQTHAGRAEACRQDGWLWLPELAPWTRREARRERAKIEGRVIDDGIKLATRRDLDRAAFDRHVEALFALVRGETDPDMWHATGYLVRSGGGDRALIAHAAELDGGADLASALVAAIQAGDRAAVARIAALPPSPDAMWLVERRRGATLCMLGDRAAGVAALERADAAMRTPSSASDGDDTARLAISACDPGRAPEVSDYLRDRQTFVRAVSGGALALPSDRAAYSADARLARLAILVRLGVATETDCLVAIAPATGMIAPTIKLLSPWAILAAPGDYPAAPAWSDAVATRLTALADATTPPKRPRRGADPAELRYEILDAAQLDPAPYLRWGALVVSLDAAVGWVRRGELDRARASAGAALAAAHHPDVVRIEPFAGVVVVAALHLVGREADAVAEADALLARLPEGADDARGVLGIQRVLLLLHAGKAEDAWAALTPMLTARMDARTATNVRWLRAAVAAMLGRKLDVSLPEPPEKLVAIESSEAALSYWWSAATGTPAVRADRRWSMDGIEPGYFDNVGVLPAQLTLIGKAAGDGDVELWLDTVTVLEITDPQALAAARAEAARWRGDTAAAAAWDQRLAAMRSLATDDRTAFLLSVAVGH